MRLKRMLAVLLSLAVLVGMVPVAGMVMTGMAADEPVEVIAYVKEGGNKDGSTAAKAGDWATAFQRLKDNNADIGIIRIVSAKTKDTAVTLPATIEAAGVDELQIVGHNDKMCVKMTGAVTVKNNLTLDNIKLSIPVGDTKYKFTLDGVSFTTGVDFESGYLADDFSTSTKKADNSPYIWMAAQNGSSTTPAPKSRVYLQAGSFKNIVVGATNNAAATIAGAEIIVDTGKPTGNWQLGGIVLGARGRNAKTTFTDDIDITLKGGYFGDITALSTNEYQNDAKVRIIQYQKNAANTFGVDYTVSKTVRDTYNETNRTESDAIPFYKVVLAEDMEDLLTPAATGAAFTFAGNKKLQAVKTYKLDETAATGAATIGSNGKTLTLTDTGIYTVSKMSQTIDTASKDIYVDATAAAGGDGTSAKPFNSLAVALAEAEGRTSAKIILKSDITLPAAIDAGDTPLTITSATPATPVEVKINGCVQVKSNLTLDALELHTASNNSLFDHWFDVYGVTFKTTGNFKSGYKMAETTVSMGGSPSIRFGTGATTLTGTAVLGGGSFHTVDIGKNANDFTAGKINITVDGAQVYTLSFDRNKKTGTKLTDDINIVLKSGTFPNAGTSYGIITRGGTMAVETGVDIHIIRHAEFVDKSGHNDIFLFNETDETVLNRLKAVRRWIDVEANIGMALNSDGTFAVTTSGRQVTATKVGETTGVDSTSFVLPALTAGVYTVVPKIDPTPKDIYVDTAATATGADGTAAKPFNTIAAAMADAKGRDSVKLLLKGEFTLPEELAEVPMVIDSIESANPAVLTVNKVIPVKKNLTLANVKVLVPETNKTHEYGFALDGVTFETTEKFDSGYLTTAPTAAAKVANGITVYMGDDAALTPKNTVILKGGKFGSVTFGGRTAQTTINGADVIVDGAGVEIGALYIFSRANLGSGNPGNNKTTINGDINIYLKQGKVASGQSGIVGLGGKETTVAADKRINVMISKGVSGLPSKAIFNALAAPTAADGFTNAYRQLNLPVGVVLTAMPDGTYMVAASTEIVATAAGAAGVASASKVLPALAAGVYDVTKVPNPESKNIYVDDSVTASGDGLAPATAFKTIDEALALAADYASATFFLKGEFTLPEKLGTNPLTITSTDPGAKATIELDKLVTLKSDLVLQDVKMVLDTKSNSQTKGFVLDGVKFETTADFVSGYAKDDDKNEQKTGYGPTLYMGDGVEATAKNTILLKGGYFNSITFGGNNAQTTINGADVTIDGAKVNVGAFYIMSRASLPNISQDVKNPGNYKTTIAEDINIYLINGKAAAGAAGYVGVNGDETSIAAGKHVNIIEYTGFDSASIKSTNVYGVFASTPAAVVEQFANARVHLNLASGIKLTANADSTYTADSTTEVIATKAGADGVVSANKVLPALTAGVYNVAKKPYDEHKTIYVDSAATAGGTGEQTSPVGTLEEAVALAADYASATLSLKGELIMPTSIGTNPLTIKSTDAGAVATIIMNEGCTVVKADLKLDNVKVLTSATGVAQQKGFILDGVTFETTENFVSGYKDGDAKNEHKTDYAPTLYMGDGVEPTAKNTILLKGGYISSITFGGAKEETTINGADVTIDGKDVKVGSMFVMSRAGSHKTTIADDINIALKKGTVCAGQTAVLGVWGNDTNVVAGKRIVVVEANGVSGAKAPGAYKVSDKDTDAGLNNISGALYYLSVAKDITVTYANGKYTAVAKREVTATTADGSASVTSVNKEFTLDKAGVYTVVLQPFTTAADIYVDAVNGVDENNNDGTAAKPFKTIEEAMSFSEGRPNAVIYLKGEFTMPAKLADAPITIKSWDDANRAVIVMSSRTVVINDLTMDNVKVILDANKDVQNKAFVLDGVKFTATANFESGYLKDDAKNEHKTGYAPTIYMGDGVEPTAKNTIVLNGGYFNSITFGGANAETTINGADVTVDGKDVKLGSMFVMSRAGSHKTTIADDINIFLKKGTVCAGQTGVIGVWGNDTSVVAGKRIVVVEANGVSGAKAPGAYKVSDKDTDAALNNINGALYYLSVAKGIEVKYENGKFIATAKREVTATTADGSASVTSVNKEFALDKAGVYTVVLQPFTTAADIYVDAVNGVDENNNDGTAAKPFKTIEEAMSFAEGRPNAVVYLKGEFTMPAKLADAPITIKSWDDASRAVLVMSSRTVVVNDLTMDNVKVVLDANKDVQNKAFVLDGVKFTATANFESGYIKDDAKNEHKPGYGPTIYMGDGKELTAKNTIVLNGGYFNSITFGGANVETTIDGADVIVDGADVKVGSMFVMSRATSKKTTIVGDIYINLKKGTVCSGQAGVIGVWGNDTSVATGKRIIVVEANGVSGAKASGAFKISEKDTDAALNNINGALYYLSVSKGIEVAYADGKFIAAAKREVTATTMDGKTSVTSTNMAFTLDKAGVYRVTLQPFTTAAEIYVDAANGVDENNNDGTAAKPFKTIDEALSFSEGRPNVVIFLRGEFTLPKMLADAPITIKSWDNNNRAVVVLATRTVVINDLTLDNIKVVLSETKNPHEKAFVLDGVKFTTTVNFDSGYAKGDDKNEHKHGYGPTIYMGDDKEPTAKNTIVLNSGYFNSITFGGPNAETIINGADITINSHKVDGVDKNGNKVKQEVTRVGGLFVFSRASSKKTTIADDVVIRLNAGSVCAGSAAVLQVWGGDETSIVDGKKIVIIQANGVDGARGEAVAKVSQKDSKTGQPTSDTSMNNILAATYYLKTANGVVLDYANGAFKVDAKKEVEATTYINNKEVVVKSVNKVLTLKDAGTYDVRLVGSAQVYKIEFSKYDWTQTYTLYKGQAGVCYGYTPTVGDKITISFDYCTMGPTEMRFGNDWASPSRTPVGQKWTNNEDYWFEVLQVQDEAPHRGSFTWTFTVKKEDAFSDDGKPRTLRWFWQQAYSGSGDPMFYDFYFWNFKITVNDSPKNIVMSDPYRENAASRITWEVDIDPDTIMPPEDWKVEDDEEEKNDIEVDLTDPDDDAVADPVKKSNLGVILGAAGGGVVLLGGAGTGLFFFLKKKKKKVAAVPPTDET